MTKPLVLTGPGNPSIDSISIKPPLGGAMTGNNPTTDRSKPGTKRHILTDKKGIPLSAVISSASTLMTSIE